jgi:anti-sigma regulatory factor (Ser/Thr protein kinase)
MEVTAQQVLPITESSQPGQARRLAQDMAERAGMDAVDAGNAAIVASEMATNLVKHARDGHLVVASVCVDDVSEVRLLAFDRGPGIRDLAGALRDGMSTAGSNGTGLGAIGRLAAEFDVHTGPGGTVLYAAVRPRTATAAAADGLRVGALAVPMRGETECGDGVEIVRAGSRLVVLVVDGLGHGSGAAAASRAAIAAFRKHAAESPKAQMTRIHEALRGTRGAAASIAELDRERRLVRFAGIGNVAGTLVGDGTSRSTVSHHGTLGHEVRRIDEFQYAWAPGTLVVLHSDGIGTRWTLDAYPGLARRHPMLTAGTLFRDFARGRDDATVVVVGEAA